MCYNFLTSCTNDQCHNFIYLIVRTKVLLLIPLYNYCRYSILSLNKTHLDHRNENNDTLTLDEILKHLSGLT